MEFYALNVTGSLRPLPISHIPLGCKDQKVQDHVNVHVKEVNRRVRRQKLDKRHVQCQFPPDDSRKSAKETFRKPPKEGKRPLRTQHPAPTTRQSLANRAALLNFALPKLVVLKDMRCTSRTSHSCYQFLLRTPPLPPRPKPQCHCRHLFFFQKTRFATM